MSRFLYIHRHDYKIPSGLKKNKEMKWLCKIYLVNAVVIPMRIDFTQLRCESVVFPQENGMQSDQHDLLIDSCIACFETIEVSAGSFAIFVWLLFPRWQEILQTQIAKRRIGVEVTAAEGAQLVGRLFIRAVNETGVQVAGHCVVRGARSQFAFVF